MHDEAHAYVAQQAPRFGPYMNVVDLGGRNVNGSVRPLFGDCLYDVVDVEPGPGVNIVEDAADWRPATFYDAVVCCEVFEHTPRWPEILDTAAWVLRPGRVAIFTAAAPPRAPHSAFDGGALREGEYYGNVDPLEFHEELEKRFQCVQVTTHPRGDVYAIALRRP